MRWSWRIGRIAGIGVFVHATFVFLLAWVALAEYHQGGTLESAAVSVGLVLAIFAIVVLHELGHALTARHFGIATRDITLLPIGGVARLERMPKDPRQELLVALAGPAVNLLLAIVLYAVLAASGGAPATTDLTYLGGASGGRAFLAQLLSVNVWIGAFNLIPAFPMDGGRVLRAVIALRNGDYARATATAARVGRGFALVFGLVGLLVVNNPFLVFIALFVWLGAVGEASAVQTSSTLEGVPAARVMIRDVRTLAPTDPLSHAVQLILNGFQQDFPVVERGELVGVLTRRDLFRALAERGDATPVSEAMHREFQVTDPAEPVEEVLTRLRTCDCQSLPVVRGRELLGLLSMENVGEYMAIQTALRDGRG